MNTSRDKSSVGDNEIVHESNHDSEPVPAIIDKSRRAIIFSCVCSGLAFVVGLVGGIPGLIDIKDYWDRVSARIKFNEKETIFCEIYSKTDSVQDGKIAVLLYGLRIVGAGEKNFVACDVIISLRYKNRWYTGKEFTPIKNKVTGREGWSGDVIQIMVGTKVPYAKNNADRSKGVGKGDILYLLDWVDFDPGFALGYGEPKEFMVANYFPDAPANLGIPDKMRITIVDYLGNEFTDEFMTDFAKRIPFKLYLNQNLDQTKN